jgi:hypothetical protein
MPLLLCLLTSSAQSGATYREAWTFTSERNPAVPACPPSFQIGTGAVLWLIAISRSFDFRTIWLPRPANEQVCPRSSLNKAYCSVFERKLTIRRIASRFRERIRLQTTHQLCPDLDEKIKRYGLERFTHIAAVWTVPVVFPIRTRVSVGPRRRASSTDFDSTLTFLLGDGPDVSSGV